jgi:hypothetical protein
MSKRTSAAYRLAHSLPTPTMDNRDYFFDTHDAAQAFIAKTREWCATDAESLAHTTVEYRCSLAYLRVDPECGAGRGHVLHVFRMLAALAYIAQNG